VARVRCVLATAVVVVAVLAAAALGAGPVLAQTAGGAGGSAGAAAGGTGGTNSTAGTGGTGGTGGLDIPSDTSGGGGGGGSGINGGNGGLDGGGGANGGPGGTSPGAAGGAGGNGSILSGGGGGGGGGGAAGTVVSVSNFIIVNSVAILGGNGGSGGVGTIGFAQTVGASGGGGGGAGGIGLIVNGTGGVYTNKGLIQGGTGGGGGLANIQSGGFAAGNGNGGNGGGGGAGAVLQSGTTFYNSGMVAGGNGGSGGAVGPISSGANGKNGSGGDGVVGANLTVINSGTISGGAAGGAGASAGNTVNFTGGANFYNGTGGTLNGNIAVSGSLTFTQTATVTLSNTITDSTGGAGTIFQIGPGTLILTGTNGFTGATTINGGVLEVDGSTVTSSLTTVNSTGMLTGVGAVGETQIKSGGTLAPGSHGGIGTLSINGSLTFAPGAIFQVQVNPSTSSFANVTGDAALAGTVNAVFDPGSYVSKQYTILQSAGLNGTTFSGLTNTYLPPGITDNLSYSPNDDDVFLNLTASLGASTPLNPTQQTIANAINNFFNAGGALPPGFFSLFNLTGSSLANALTQIDGEDATGAERGAFDLMNGFLTLMLDPYGYGRGGVGPSGQPLGFAPDQPDSLPPDIALAYAEVLKAPPQQTFEQRWTAWGSGFGGSAMTNGNPVIGSDNVTTNTYGYAAGMDYRYSPDTVLGFALAGGGTSWNLAQGLGTGRSDAFLAGLYGVTRQGPLYLAGALAAANNWFTTDRVALGDQLTASFQGQSYAARLEGGYRFAVPTPFLPGSASGRGLGWGLAGVTPYAAVQVQDFHTPAYSETDLTAGGFGLSYAAMNGTDARSELGARFDDPTLLGNMPLILRARVAWAHDWVSNPALNASFESLPGTSFTVFGAPLPQNSALTSTGAQLFFTPNWSLLAKFDGEFSAGSQLFAGTGTLRYTW
jgi:uncharacterized protein with beta-barrel porin domain